MDENLPKVKFKEEIKAKFFPIYHLLIIELVAAAKTSEPMLFKILPTSMIVKLF